jgi:exodeoxyribonuclease VII large subunit
LERLLLCRTRLCYHTLMAGPVMHRQIYRVSQIVELLARELETAFPDIWVEGEVSSFKKAASGHMYFTLKEGRSSLKCVMFRSYAGRLPFTPENGMLVLARGKLSLYAGSGDLQLYATIMEPSGLGAMQAAFEQAKKRLMEEGLTDPGRKRPIPPFPRRVGLVTSLEGAAIRDVFSVLSRRGAAFEVVVRPALVQGPKAPETLRQALASLSRLDDLDVILLTRGGGSMEDLWAFNDEELARMVAACPIPIVSAVGHEVDTVLTDLTADLRAPTPSVAAELLTAATETVLVKARDGERRIRHLMQSRWSGFAERLRLLQAERLPVLVTRRIEQLEEYLDRLQGAVRRCMEGRWSSLDSSLALLRRALTPESLRRWIEGLEVRTRNARKALAAAQLATLRQREARVTDFMRLLDSFSPLKVVGRGYAIAFGPNRKILTDASKVRPGDRVSVALRKGHLACRLEEASVKPAPELPRGVDVEDDPAYNNRSEVKDG